MSEHNYSAYTHGCRCDSCKKAKADYMRTRRAEARVKAMKHSESAPRGTLGKWRYVAPIERHGTRFGYEEHGCRCEDCTEARSTSDKRYRANGAEQ